jgi:DNA-damage-inducible protein J
MNQALVNIRMDADLKKDMELTCKELGLNMTTAFTIFAKKMTREKRIPFDVSIDAFYSERNMQSIQESVEQFREGKTVTFTMDELEAMEDMPPDAAREFVERIRKRQSES